MRTFNGHRQAVKDATFNNDGKQFLSAAYDRFCKLWDTETGIYSTCTSVNVLCDVVHIL